MRWNWPWRLLFGLTSTSKNFGPAAKFATWLYHIALNLCRDHLKSRAYQDSFQTVSFYAPTEEGGDPSLLLATEGRPDQKTDRLEELIALEKAIGELPEELKNAFILTTLEDRQHVETVAICIYSQLRSFSSSEVAAMIEGLVRHDTEMRVEKNFVDSHGQSEVALAFRHLLGTVRLMPRLKPIKYERLYLPAKGMVGEFPNLTGVLTRPIRGDLITQQYDEMVKAAVALKDGTATAEAILRRFNSYNG